MALRIRLVIFHFASLIAAACYSPDGTLETNTDYQPCVAKIGTFSMCCATNRSEFADQCLPNGICSNPCGLDGLCGPASSTGTYWREFCTDPTWQSPFCLKDVCTDPSTGGISNSTSAVSQCPTDGKWCCGGDIDADECCAENVNRVAIAATIGVSSQSSKISTTSASSSSSAVIESTPTSAITTSSSSPSSAAETTTSSAAATSLSAAMTSSSAAMTSLATSSSATAIATSQPSNTTGKIGLGIGIGIGGACGIAAIVVGVWYTLHRRKPVLQRRETNAQDFAYSSVFPRAELDASRRAVLPMAEMDARQREAVEMSG